jgi:hypothetical protein
VLVATFRTAMHSSFAYDLIAVEQPSAATVDLLKMPVRRKDTGETVALGSFLASMTARCILPQSSTPTVAVIIWGRGADTTVFYQAIEAIKMIGLHGGEWNAEGFGSEFEAGHSIQWVSAYAVAEADDFTYDSVSPVANFKAAQESLAAWTQHIVRPVAKNDSLSFMIVSTAATTELAQQIKEAAKECLALVCFPHESE